jgi:hypothetical protein
MVNTCDTINICGRRGAKIGELTAPVGCFPTFVETCNMNTTLSIEFYTGTDNIIDSSKSFIRDSQELLMLIIAVRAVTSEPMRSYTD